MRRRRVSMSHVIWAYEHIVRKYSEDGDTPPRIRERLREEHHLHVGTDAIRTVLDSAKGG